MSEGDCLQCRFHGQGEGSVGTWERGLISISRPRLGWQASAYGTGARLAAWAIAALVCLVLATEARADDGSAQLDGGAAAEPVIPDAGPVPPPTDQLLPDQAPPDESPGSGQSPVDETPAPGEAPVDGAPSPGEAPPPEPPPSDSPAPEPTPAPEPPPAEPTPAEPTPTAEPTVVTPAPTDPAPEPVLALEPGSVEGPAAGPPRDPIVIINRGASPVPSLLPSPAGNLIAATGTGGRLGPQGSPRPQDGSERMPAAANAHKAPPLPGLPFSGGAPSDLYVSAGGSSGSSGGFSPLVLAGLVALLAAAAQRCGGLISLKLAPPRCSAFVLCLERPD